MGIYGGFLSVVQDFRHSHKSILIMVSSNNIELGARGVKCRPLNWCRISSIISILTIYSILLLKLTFICCLIPHGFVVCLKVVCIHFFDGLSQCSLLKQPSMGNLLLGIQGEGPVFKSFASSQLCASTLQCCCPFSLFNPTVDPSTLQFQTQPELLPASGEYSQFMHDS